MRIQVPSAQLGDNMKIKTYNVVLELLDVDVDDLEDAANALYEAGCDDALVFATNGVAYIEFDRQAVSGFDAILGAQVDVKKAGYNSKLVTK